MMAGCVPVEFGGLGVEAMHDTIIGISRLGRGDGSTAIAATMHLFSSWMLARGWRAAIAAGETPLAERAASILRQIGAGQLVQCSPQSERGTDMLHPLVEATKVEGGWHLNGAKSLRDFVARRHPRDDLVPYPGWRGRFPPRLSNSARGKCGHGH